MLAMKLASNNSASTIHTARAIASQRPCRRGPRLFGVVATASWLMGAAERCRFKRLLPLKLPSLAHVLEQHQVFGSSLTYDTIAVQETLRYSLRTTNLSDFRVDLIFYETMLGAGRRMAGYFPCGSSFPPTPFQQL